MEIQLSKGMVALVDDEDFEWLNQFKWYAVKGHNCYYAKRNDYSGDRQTTVKMHRAILGLTDPKVIVDHKDHNGLNNRRNNIRECTRSQNMSNKTSHKNSNSKYLGVSFHKGIQKFTARIQSNKKLINIGVYNTELDAAIAYNQSALKHHGEFANLNIII